MPWPVRLESGAGFGYGFARNLPEVIDLMDTVFVHTNHRQLTGALVSAYSLKRNSRQPDKFEVKIIRHEDYPFFAAREGQAFLRGNEKRIWLNEDLQSFTPLRFMPPELMGYQGRCVVTDPDVFAVGDVMELLSRDMQGNRILCRPRSGARSRGPPQRPTPGQKHHRGAREPGHPGGRRACAGRRPARSARRRAVGCRCPPV